MKNSTPSFLSILLALYASSIVVGAGILWLPNVAIRVGIAPMLFLLTANAILFYFAYKNLLFYSAISLRDRFQKKLNIWEMGAKQLHFGNTDEEGIEKDTILHAEAKLSGSLLVDDAIKRVMGKYGLLSLLLGISIYVGLACISYLIIGSRCIYMLSNTTPEAAAIGKIFMTAFAMALITFSTYLAIRKFKLSKQEETSWLIFTGCGSWILGISIIKIVEPEHYFAGLLLSLCFFFMAVLLPRIILRRYPQDDEIERNSGKVWPEHGLQVMLMVSEILLLILGLILALLVLGRGQTILWFPTRFDWGFLEAILVGQGTVMFAYVGTGLYNILIYPEILIGDKKVYQRISLFSILIPFMLYVVVILIIASILPSNTLLQANDVGESFIEPLIRALSSSGNQIVAMIIMALISTFVLLAVTSALLGFSDTLAERISIFKQKSDNKPKYWYYILITTTIVAVALLTLEGFDYKTDIASKSISVAGAMGGGLFALVIPFLLKDRSINSPKKVGWDIGIILAFLTIGIIVLSTIVSSQSLLSYGIIGLILFLISLVALTITTIVGIAATLEKSGILINNLLKKAIK